jgi:hypothetical protein
LYSCLLLSRILMLTEIMAATHTLLPRLREENVQLDNNNDDYYSGNCKKEKRSKSLG